MRLTQEVKCVYVNLEFLFDDYIKDHLLKLDVDAEKIVIYLTPYILKVNLEIIIYEFDKDSTVLSKEFPCHLDNKSNIVLLYRKTHYDLIYDSKTFELFTKDLCYYVNLDENFKVVSQNMLDKLKFQEFSGSSHIQVNCTDKEIKAENELVRLDCISCSKSISNKLNFLNICSQCLNNELFSQIMANYMVFLTESISLFQANQEKKIPALYNQIFNQNQIKLHNKQLSLSYLAHLVDNNISQVIKSVKSKICAICSTNMENTVASDFNFELPCKCKLCSKNCFNTIFHLVFKKKRYFDETICICGYGYHNNDFKDIYNILDKAKLKDHKKIIETILTQSMLNICAGGCMNELNTSTKDFNLIKFKDPALTKLFTKKEFKHVICIDCIKIRKLKEKDLFDCVICNSSHRIEKIKKNYVEGDDECMIL